MAGDRFELVEDDVRLLTGDLSVHAGDPDAGMAAILRLDARMREWLEKPDARQKLWDGVDDHDRRLGDAMLEAGVPIATVNLARQGRWSDFKTDLTFPKQELVAVCRKWGAEELAERVMKGEFDG